MVEESISRSSAVCERMPSMDLKKRLKSSSVLISLLLAAVLAFAFASLLSRGKGGPNKRQRIVVVLPSSTNAYWLDVRQGAEDARRDVGEFDVEIKVSTGDQDSKAQAFMLEDLASQANVAAVVVGPASASEPIPALAHLDRKGIATVVIDTTLNEQKLKEFGYQPKAFVGSNNRDGARKAARAIAEEVKKRGSLPPPYSVLVLEGNRVHQSGIDRAEAFYEEARILGMTTEGVRADWNRAKAQDWTTQKFSAGRRPSAIFASNDTMALGAIAALKSLAIGADEWPVIVGFDYTEPAIRAIESGDMFASARQDPIAMAKMGVRLARQAALKDPALPSAPQYLPVDIFPQVRSQ